MNNSKLTLFLIFTLALSLRISFIIFYDNGKMLKNINYAADEYSYDQIATNLINGKGMVTDDGLYARRPPVYPLFLAVIYFFFGHSFVAVRFFQAVISAATCIVIYLIGKELFNSKVGAISALVCSVYYPFILQPAYLLTEVLFTFLLALTVYYISRSQTLNYALSISISAAALLGVSILCRDSLLALVFVLCILFFWDSGLKLRRKIINAGLCCLVVSAVIFPWGFRNYRIYHAFLPVTVGSGHTLYLGNNALTPGGTGGEWVLGQDSFFPADTRDLFSIKTDKLLKDRALKFIRDNPQRFFWLAYRKFLNMWRPFYAKAKRINKIVMLFSYVPIVISGLAGAVMSVKFLRKVIILYVLILYFSLIHMVTLSEIRYRLPIMPYLIIFSAYSLTRWHGRYKKDSNLRGSS